MNTLIFRTMAPVIAAAMILFSIVILLRGHNDPGGGFIGGLIAASAAAIYGMARGVGEVRRLMRFNPIAFAGFGVVLSCAVGLISVLAGVPFLTALWLPGYVFGVPGAFDVGVYFVVFGTMTAIVLALEDDGGGGA
jgi:multicomponent Na+:H+ antiporter subunit B